MTENKDDKLLEMMEKGFVLYSKNGIIKYIEIPDHGNIKLKVQNRQIVYKEVTNGEQC
jgi:raw score 4.38